MREERKNKIALIIAIGLPLILVLWVLVFVYLLPELFVNPKYNFIYVTSYESKYAHVENGRIQVDPCPYGPTSYRDCSSYYKEFNFYLYDVKNDESIPLSLDEAKAYKLDSSEKSPDGYVIRSSRDSSGDFFLFPFFWSSGVSRGYYITKSNTWGKQISLRDNYYNFKFLGWVLNE